MDKSILIIPDVHGRSFWETALDSDSYEKVVFLGDYTDPYGIEGITENQAIDNFEAIINFKSTNPDLVVLLLGNHDLHYFSDYYFEIAACDRYSQSSAILLKQLYQDYYDYFELAWESDWGNRHYLFSHAGITESWFKHNRHLIEQPDAEHLNKLLLSNQGVEALAQVGESRWGPYPSGSMIWADIDDMLYSEPISDTYQIFGHTMQFDSPIITDEFACLDCRAAFSLNINCVINPVTEITPYEEWI